MSTNVDYKTSLLLQVLGPTQLNLLTRLMASDRLPRHHQNSVIRILRVCRSRALPDQPPRLKFPAYQDICTLSHGLHSGDPLNKTTFLRPLPCSCSSVMPYLNISLGQTISANPRMNLTLLRDCCYGCQLVADNVEVIHWYINLNSRNDLNATLSSPQTTTPYSIVDSKNFTL